MFAPTDCLMSISLTNIRTVASSTRIMVNNVRLQGRWKAIFERKHPLETTLRAKDNLYLTAVLNMFDDVIPDSVAYFQGHFAKKW